MLLKFIRYFVCHLNFVVICYNIYSKYIIEGYKASIDLHLARLKQVKDKQSEGRYKYTYQILNSKATRAIQCLLQIEAKLKRDDIVSEKEKKQMQLLTNPKYILQNQLANSKRGSQNSNNNDNREESSQEEDDDEDDEDDEEEEKNDKTDPGEFVTFTVFDTTEQKKVERMNGYIKINFVKLVINLNLLLCKDYGKATNVSGNTSKFAKFIKQIRGVIECKKPKMTILAENKYKCKKPKMTNIRGSGPFCVLAMRAYSASNSTNNIKEDDLDFLLSFKTNGMFFYINNKLI